MPRVWGMPLLQIPCQAPGLPVGRPLGLAADTRITAPMWVALARTENRSKDNEN